MESLEYGDYYFIEEKAPKGYVTSKQEYPFSIKETGTVVPVEVTNFKEPTIEKRLMIVPKMQG